LPTPKTTTLINRRLSLWLDEKWGSGHNDSERRVPEVFLGVSKRHPFDIDVWVYIFEDSLRSTLVACTIFEDGSNLPQNAAWSPTSRMMIGPGNRPWVNEMEIGLEQDGYFLHGGQADPLDSPDIRSGIVELVRRLGN